MRVLTMALAAVVLWAPHAHAQAEGPAVPLTLADAVARALETSHRLAEALARQEGSEAAVRTEAAADNPTVALSGGYTRTNHVEEFGVPQPDGRLRVIYPDLPDNYFTRATLQWPIYTGGRTDALIRAAEAEARAAGFDVEAARADLRLEVIRAYWALVTASDAVAVMEEALARADAHLRDMRSRFDNGLVPPNEVAAVEAQRARQQMQLIETQNVRRAALEDLRRLTGIEGGVVPTEALGPSLEESTAVVLPRATVPGSRPAAAADTVVRAEQHALAERIQAAASRLDAIEAARRPSVAVTGATDYANPNPRIFPRADRWRTSWELGVTATWTLWDGRRIAAQAAEADAAVRALRARQADLDTRIATEIRQRQLDLDSARAALPAADAAVRSASEARRVVTERFNVGVATSTEVLDAHVALLQAELDRTRALANIRLAEARLDRAMGR